MRTLSIVIAGAQCWPTYNQNESILEWSSTQWWANAVFTSFSKQKCIWKQRWVDKRPTAFTYIQKPKMICRTSFQWLYARFKKVFCSSLNCVNSRSYAYPQQTNTIRLISTNNYKTYQSMISLICRVTEGKSKTMETVKTNFSDGSNEVGVEEAMKTVKARSGNGAAAICATVAFKESNTIKFYRKNLQAIPTQRLHLIEDSHLLFPWPFFKSPNLCEKITHRRFQDPSIVQVYNIFMKYIHLHDETKFTCIVARQTRMPRKEIYFSS